ncbi:uncharacterized protein [Palaemon carinicauda]|uniref:uncharacterized protein isoform X2 n=1 Tax=Palaemon carinicauda TaxID=392227 RepID=UPI0035B66595
MAPSKLRPSNDELLALRNEEEAVKKMLKIEELELRSKIEQLPRKSKTKPQEDGRNDEFCATLQDTQNLKEEEEEEERDEVSIESSPNVSATYYSFFDNLVFKPGCTSQNQELYPEVLGNIEPLIPGEPFTLEELQINNTALDLEPRDFGQQGSGDCSQDEEDSEESVESAES